MPKMTRREYCNSLIYRLVFVLSGFRRLIGDSGSDFAKAVEDKRANSTSYEPIDESFIILVDNGFEYLDDEETKLYFEHICNLYNIPKYSRNKFYKKCLAYAETIPQDFDYMSDAEKALEWAKAVYQLMT